jgi:hypothetical protein
MVTANMTGSVSTGAGGTYSIVSVLGSYNVTAPMTSSAKWIMQAVAFKAHP